MTAMFGFKSQIDFVGGEFSEEYSLEDGGYYTFVMIGDVDATANSQMIEVIISSTNIARLVIEIN